MQNVLDLTPSNDPVILQAVLSRLPGPYRTTRYVVDDDMVIDLAIHRHQLISRVCFVAVSYSHCIACKLKFSMSNCYILVKSSNNKNILTTKIV